MKLRRGGVLLGSALLLFVAASAGALLLPPSPGGIDTHAYMDPGVNLATGRGLTSTFTYGNPSFEPRLYAAYPPGFPIIYAGYAVWAGTDIEADSAFKWLAAAALSLVAFLLLRRAFARDESAGEQLLAVVLLVGLPSRFLLLSDDRPDVTGLSLALAALLVRPSSLGRIAAAGLVAGLSFIVSPICGVLAVAGIAILWTLERTSRPPFLATACVGLVGLCLPMAVALLLGCMVERDYASRLGTYLVSGGAEDAAGITTGAGDFMALLRGDVSAWWRAFFAEGLTTPHAWARVALLVIALTAASWLLVLARGSVGLGRVLGAGLILWASAFLALAIVPWNKLYAAIAAGSLLCAVVAGLPMASWQLWSRRILLAGLSLMILVQLPFGALRIYSLAYMQDSYERMRGVVAAMELWDRSGEGRTIVQLDGFAYFLFKPRDVLLVPTVHPLSAEAALLAESDYFVFSFPGSRNPLQPHRPDWWPSVAGQFELLYRPRLPQQPKLFGVPLSNSSQTWEVEIWGRKPASGASQ